MRVHLDRGLNTAAKGLNTAAAGLNTTAAEGMIQPLIETTLPKQYTKHNLEEKERRDTETLYYMMLAGTISNCNTTS